jgi:hypothetical protein
MRPHQTQFLKFLTSGPGGEGPAREFERWLEMAYCALAKPPATIIAPDRAADLEARYMRAVKPLTPERASAYAAALTLLVDDLTITEGEDFFGPIVYESGLCGRRDNDFVLTPWNLASCMAKMTLHDLTLPARGYITMAEPACGAGVLVLAAAQECKAVGINPATQLWVECVDIRTVCQQMAHIQLTLAGVAARVTCGDSLRDPLGLEARDVAWTYGCVPFIARHGYPRFEPDPVDPDVVQPITLPSLFADPQLTLKLTR